MLSVFLHLAMQAHLIIMNAHVALFSQGIIPMVVPPLPGG